MSWGCGQICAPAVCRVSAFCTHWAGTLKPLKKVCEKMARVPSREGSFAEQPEVFRAERCKGMALAHGGRTLGRTPPSRWAKPAASASDAPGGD
eukprot:2798460-Prymnesium_polylepis.1